MEQIDVSVVICTHNPERSVLSRVLSALEEQTLDPNRWELIIVDNASDTKLKSDQFEISQTQFKVIREEKLGLSHGRKRGVLTAVGKYLVFVDDDNILSSDFLKCAVTIMDESPHVGALGGRAIPESSVPLPVWFNTFAANYAVGVQAPETSDVTQRKYVWGAGMVVRTNVFKKMFQIGVSSLLTDRKGQELASGGDSEMCRWLILRGYSLMYDESLVLTHFMHPSRLTKSYLKRLCDGHSQVQKTLHSYDVLIGCPPKYSYAWWKRSLVNLYFLVVTFGRVANRPLLESLDVIPFFVFDKNVRAVKATAKLLREMTG